MQSRKKVSFHTLGCKLNFSETSTLARRFAENGYERTDSQKGADICIVNTCSVTEHAEKKCRNLIRRLVRNNPGAIVAVTGCYAQLRPEAISDIEGVDIVIGNNEKDTLFERVSQIGTKKAEADVYSCDASELTSFFSAFSTGDRTRAFLKIQDGCSYKCSYCTIPYARGESRNSPIKQVVEEARKIAEAGQKEIVVTGINTGDFGHTTGERFIDLLIQLDKIEGIERYRISSIEPNLLTDEIISFTSSSGKFQPHFHIPLQSGSDRILGLMRRRYTTALFAERIAAVRHKIPDAFIGIDVIAGFPGETDSDFVDTLAFIELISPSFIHVFPYSARPGTPASEMAGRVPPSVTAERVKKLTGLSDRQYKNFCRRFINGQARVLFESTNRRGYMGGFTGNYVKVTAPYDKTLINTIQSVIIGNPTESGDYSVEIIRS